MNKSESIGELAAALAKAQGEFKHAKKDVANLFFKSKYADLSSVIDAAKKPLSDNGLAVIQTMAIKESGVVLITTLAHSSGQWIEGSYPISPIKNDPQAYGSACTYARRYCFSAITGIAADDDDGNAASGKTDTKAKIEVNKQSKFIDEQNPLQPKINELKRLASEDDVDNDAIREAWRNLDSNKQQIVWKMLTTKEHAAIRHATQGAAA